MNKTNEIWQDTVSKIMMKPDYVVSPRGMEVKEIINGSYRVPMPAYLDLIDRKINTRFMFAEAAWIISGSNRLSDLTPTMESYRRFSDDGVFLKGAYGPKVVDQLGYIVDTLVEDIDSRQAVLTIWRERPGKSKDIPCTVMMQFFIREEKLQMVVTMRSHDIILGATYDMFTFSMVGLSVLLLLRARGLQLSLGDLSVNSGSLHLYSNHYDEALRWSMSAARDLSIKDQVNEVIEKSSTYEELIINLKKASKNDLL